MKRKGKQLMSILLTLVMLLGMVPGMTIEARADGNVATIGATGYATLQEALDAATDGQTVMLLKDVTANVGFGTMYDTTSKSVTLDLNGNSVTGSEIYAIMVWIGSLTLTDSGSGGKITNPSGGAVSVKGGATFIMKGGSLCNNKPTSSYGGAGVVNLEQRYVQGAVQSGKFQMEGGAIENNESSANTGCGVYMSPGSTFTMTGGRISNNTGNNSVGVYVAEGSTFTMTGGEISGNTAASSVQGYSPYGAGVRVQVGGNAVFGGTAKVTGNKKIVESNEIPNNVDLQGQNEETRAKIKVSTTTPFAEGASVGITLGTQDGKGVFTKDIADDNARNAAKPYFFSDDPKLSVLPTVAADNANYQLKLDVLTYAKLEKLTITNSTNSSRNGTKDQENTYPWVGDVLQANVDGATPVTYQWYRVDADGKETLIEGATAQTYKATAADVDCHLKVVATQIVNEASETLDSPITKSATIGPVALRPAPTDFTETHPTYPNSTNGQITKNRVEGVDIDNYDNLYYSADNGKTWNKVDTTGKTAINLSAGTYLFQYRDSASTEGKHAESKIATVILTPENDLIWLKITKVSPEDKKVNEVGATVKAVTNLDEKGGNLPVDTTLTYNWYFIDKDGTREETPVATNSATCEILESYAGGKLLAEAVWKNGDTVIKTLTTPTPIIAASPASTYTVSGSVKKLNSAEENATTSGVADATVELRQGNTVIATATTDGDGNYTFVTKVPNGEYNIVVTTSDGKTTKTEQVTVNDNDAEKTVLLPYYDVSSLIVVRGNTPAVVVSSLDKLAATQSAGISDDSTAVEVKLTVEGKADLTNTPASGLTTEQRNEKVAQESVKTEAQRATGTTTVVEFVDMGIIKTVTPNAGAATESTIYSTGNNVLEIVVPYTTAGKYNIGVYRRHVAENGAVSLKTFEELPIRPTTGYSDGKFYVGNGYIDVFATKFSTYAIGYTTTQPVTRSSGGGGSAATTYPVTVSTPTNGTAKADKSSAAPNAKVTVTATPNDGYKVNTVTVTDKNGKTVSVTKNSNGTWSFTMPASTVTVNVTFAKAIASPKDTGVADWLITDDHIIYLRGYGDGTISPNNNITRAEVSMIFYRLLLKPQVEIVKTFPDVKGIEWYATAVNTLANLGIVNGYDDGLFHANNPITRAEFAAIATRFAKATGGTVSFTDVASAHWAYGNIATAADYGWVTGYEGMFRPADKITRAETATIVNHMLGRAADQEYVLANSSKIKYFPDLQDATKWYYFDMIEAGNEHDFTRENDVEKWTAK